MMASVTIVLLVLKRLFLLLLPLVIRADMLDDAARTLAAKVASHLEANETVRITAHNLSSVPASTASRLQATFEQALRKRVRNPVAVGLTVTLSENVKGFLLVAQIRKGDSETVEMAEFTAGSPPSPAALVPVSRLLLWEQSAPILDLLPAGGRMYVLEPEALVQYERQSDHWQPVESSYLVAPPQRDPRGRIEMMGEMIAVFLPGATCRGTGEPMKLTCEPTATDFMLNGAPVHFTPGRNMIEGQSMAAPPETGDAVAVCGGKLLASGADGPDVPDIVRLFDGPAIISEPVEFSGPVTALWPLSRGALAVSRNLKTMQYEAYVLTPDCGR
jgi:hypothetical protein